MFCTPGQVTAVETERMYVVTLWLPGVDARSLRINQTARRLTVSGSRSRGAGGQGAERFALGWDLPVRSAPHQHQCPTLHVRGYACRFKCRRYIDITPVKKALQRTHTGFCQRSKCCVAAHVEQALCGLLGAGS